eukprot:6467204-Amphidinium_carterae.1
MNLLAHCSLSCKDKRAQDLVPVFPRNCLLSLQLRLHQSNHGSPGPRPKRKTQLAAEVCKRRMR